MDFEGAGPLPGTTGRVVGLPRTSDPRRCVAVKFDEQPGDWLIPGAYLEPPGS